MARPVSSLVQALDAAIAGEVGHKRINRLLMLHDQKDRTLAEVEEYWAARGRIAKIVRDRLPGTPGLATVNRFLQLHDNLEASRGVTHPQVLEVREAQKAEYWVLRGRLADDIDWSLPAEMVA